MNRYFFSSLVFFAFSSVQSLYSQHLYHTKKGTSFKFQEQTWFTSTLSVQGGEYIVDSEHSSLIALEFTADNKARAIYEKLSITSESPDDYLTPDTDYVLNIPFILDFNQRGEIETLETPEFYNSLEPENNIQEITNLNLQFEDFFVRLPGEPLETGKSWTYTISSNDEETKTNITTTHVMVVQADSLVGGELLKVIRYRSELTIEIKDQEVDTGVNMHAQLKGKEDGTILFSPVLGMMVYRERHGVQQGDLKYKTNGQDFIVPYMYEYESDISLVK